MLQYSLMKYISPIANAITHDDYLMGLMLMNMADMHWMANNDIIYSITLLKYPFKYYFTPISPPFSYSLGLCHFLLMPLMICILFIKIGFDPLSMYDMPSPTFLKSVRSMAKMIMMSISNFCTKKKKPELGNNCLAQPNG